MMNRNLNTSIAALVLLMVSTLSYAQITGKVSADANKTKYIANTVVYIENVEGTFHAPKANPSMNQKNLTFIPRVLPVVQGSIVDFLNDDNVQHNVFSPDLCAEKFNLGSWGKGEVRSHKYDKIGCQSVVLCNIHPEMEAYIIVLQNPYYSVTDADGNFTIKNVPAGNYNLKIWNEKLKSADQKITVSASGKATVNFVLAR